MACLWKLKDRLNINVPEVPTPGAEGGRLESVFREKTAGAWCWVKGEDHSNCCWSGMDVGRANQEKTIDLLRFLWSHWKELDYSANVNSHSSPPT